MRTFLAFKLKKIGNELGYLNNINNVKKYYEKNYIDYKLSIDYHFYKNIGAFVMDDENSNLDFPTTVDTNNSNILTFFPPLNYKNFSKDKGVAIQHISEKLEEDKMKLNSLTSPFLFSVINSESEELNIYIDTLGINRLYVMENDKGVFWSNRPSALHIFSNQKAKFNRKSWQSYAVAGWFMDKDSPFEKVYRVPPSTVINVKVNDDNLYSNYTTKGIEKLIKEGSSNDINIDSIVKTMIDNLNNYIELWDLDIQVDISGGKDSRVSAASILKSKATSYSFRTINDIDEELDTSKILLQKVNNTNELRVLDPELYIKEQPDLIERVDKLLFEHDGDFPTVMISSPIIETNKFTSVKEININGFGGEIGKGAFYSNERWIEKLETIGEGAALHRLSNHFVKIGCVSEESITIMKNKLKGILSKGENLGLKGLKLLDYFYFIERFRRWTPLSGHIHCYSPFINNLFISTALNNNPHDNIKADIHNKIITTLVPEWENIDFFKATPAQSKEKDLKNLRLWQTKDRFDIEKILGEPYLWNDVFLEEEVKSLWMEAKTEGIPNYKETLFHRVALRAQFTYHLERINQTIESNKEKKMNLNYRIFSPSSENINEEVRLIIYDNNTEKFIVKEIIEENEEFEVDEEIFTGNWDFKYKYQVKRDGRWIDSGKYKRILPEKITDDGIKYLFYPNQSSEKLVVVFQAINTKQSYNYIKTLKNFNINKLFIRDDYGIDELTKSSYYLGTKKNLNIAEYTQKLISKIVKENNIDKKNIVFAGSSKGGYAALYHGYLFGAGHIIPGGPQILLGDYLYQTNPMSIRYEIFKSIVGEFTEENKEWANSLLYNVLKISKSPYPKTTIHIGNKEPHYEEHVVPFMNWIKNLKIPNVELDSQDYNTHEELAKYYPVFLEKEIMSFIAEKDV